MGPLLAVFTPLSNRAMPWTQKTSLSYTHLNRWCNVPRRWCWVPSSPSPWRSPTSTRGRGGAARTSSHERHAGASTCTRKQTRPLKPLHLLHLQFLNSPLSEAVFLFSFFFYYLKPEVLFCTLLFNQPHRWTMSKHIMNEQTHCWCFEVCFSLFWIFTRRCACPCTESS